MEQNRLPKPNPITETISPVFPRRRFGSNATFGVVAPSVFSAAPKSIAAVVVLKNSRRDQRNFIVAPFLAGTDERSGFSYLSESRISQNRKRAKLCSSYTLSQ